MDHIWVLSDVESAEQWFFSSEKNARNKMKELENRRISIFKKPFNVGVEKVTKVKLSRYEAARASMSQAQKDRKEACYARIKEIGEVQRDSPLYVVKTRLRAEIEAMPDSFHNTTI